MRLSGPPILNGSPEYPPLRYISRILRRQPMIEVMYVSKKSVTQDARLIVFDGNIKPAKPCNAVAMRFRIETDSPNKEEHHESMRMSKSVMQLRSPRFTNKNRSLCMSDSHCLNEIPNAHPLFAGDVENRAIGVIQLDGFI